MKGLPPKTVVEVQLLTNEGDNRNRRWDIGVTDGDPEDIDEDDLIIDDYTSEGISAGSDLGEEGVWTPENSFVATFDVETTDEGEETSFTDDEAERTGKPEGWYRIRDNGWGATNLHERPGSGVEKVSTKGQTRDRPLACLAV
jgi:hypothetical protein